MKWGGGREEGMGGKKGKGGGRWKKWGGMEGGIEKGGRKGGGGRGGERELVRRKRGKEGWERERREGVMSDEDWGGWGCEDKERCSSLTQEYDRGRRDITLVLDYLEQREVFRASTALSAKLREEHASKLLNWSVQDKDV
ncbi:hypothetical protein Tco_0005099 [Tanacetum coccineum]